MTEEQKKIEESINKLINMPHSTMYTFHIAPLISAYRKVEKQNKQLIEALEFYADEATYDISHLEKHGYIIIDSDGGAKAQHALQQIQGDEES